MTNRTLPIETRKLLEVYNKIKNKENWIRFSYKQGEAYCLIGAVMSINYHDPATLYDLLFLGAELSPGSTLWRFNDTSTHGEVLTAVKNSITISLEKYGILITDIETLLEPQLTQTKGELIHV